MVLLLVWLRFVSQVKGSERRVLEEVPVAIKNSHLLSALMWEEKSILADKHQLLSLSSRSELTIWPLY